MKFSIGFQFNIELTRNGKTTRLSLPSWKRLRRQVKTRDESTCQYCGTEAQVGQVDHVVPLSRGGTDTIDNLVWSCRPCNLSKRDKLLNEWQYNPMPEKQTGKTMRAIDLTLPDIDIRSELVNAKAHKDTRIVIRAGDDYRSPRIVCLSSIWDILEVSYKTGNWTKRIWAQERGLSQTAWFDYQNFLKRLKLWKFDNPTTLKLALYQFYYPIDQEKNARL